MKTLILVRHASAEASGENGSDLSRSLIKEGVQEAKKAARRIKETVEEGIPTAIFISSPAARSLETAHIFSKILKYPEAKILIKESLYQDASLESLLGVIGEIEDSYNTIFLFGHNPSLSDWASSFGRNIDLEIPKAGIVAFTFEKESWKEVAPREGRIKYFLGPKDKSRKTEEFEKRLSDRLATHIAEWLDEIAGRHDLKAIEKHASKIIKKVLRD